MINGKQLWLKIRQNSNLEALEKAGLFRGEERGKSPKVPVDVLRQSLHKQYLDFLKAYGDDDSMRMKQCLADLRNVAGIYFLVLDGETFETKKHAP